MPGKPVMHSASKSNRRTQRLPHADADMTYAFGYHHFNTERSMKLLLAANQVQWRANAHLSLQEDINCYKLSWAYHFFK